MMICPICQKILVEDENKYSCEQNHSFDKAKSGYINLLINSSNSGDNKIMIDSRKLILESGYYQPLAFAIKDIVKKYNISRLLDVGCGEGYYSNVIQDFLDITVVGLDISKYACLKASKSYQNILFVVASMANIPFQDNSFDAILSNFAPHNEVEFKRIASKYIIKIIPSSNHLVEIKELLYEDVILKESKVPNFVGFKLIEEVDLKYKKYIEEVYDLVKMTPYYYKTKIDEKELSNYKAKVSFEFKLLVFEKTGDL